MNKSKMHTRLENTALKAMLERCVKQVDEKNARIRDFHEANSKLVKIADDLKKENEALKARPRVITPVFMICNAYESGIGHGLQCDGLANPYPPEAEEFEAYRIGYEEGVDRAKFPPQS